MDMRALREGGWIDELTRVVSVQFVLFNGNWQYWLTAMLSVEFLPGGLLRPIARVYSFQPDLTVESLADNGAMRRSLFLDMARLVIGVIGLISTMVSEIRHERLLERSVTKYLISVRCVVDILIFAGTVGVVTA